jgi:LysR family transcriptional regulator, low CO2-responsive transcriptional regulator
MNFTHLAAFHAVAESGSVTAAAERLHVSQPALTREIRELEERLDVALFDRLPRGMQLTEAGLLLNGYAAQIFRLAESGESAVSEFAGLKRGHLSIAASRTVGVYLLPPLMDEFRNLYPGVTLDIEISNTERVQEGVLAHKHQLGLIEGPYDATSFDALLFGHDEIIAVAGSTHPFAKRRKLNASALAQTELVLRETGSGTRDAVEQAYAEQNLALSPTCSIGSPEAIKRMLRLGHAVSWVPRLSVMEELASGTLVELSVSDVSVTRDLNLLWRRGHSLSPGARAFRALAERHIGGSPHAGRRKAGSRSGIAKPRE